MKPAELEKLQIELVNANPMREFVIGHTYTILGIPPAWVKGRVVAENMVCVVLAPGALRLGDAANGEQDYETVTSGPSFKFPIVIRKSAIVQSEYHGE